MVLIRMTTVKPYDRRKFKAFQNSDEELLHSWIKGLIEQVEFANQPDVLPDFGPPTNPMKFYDDRTLQECR